MMYDSAIMKSRPLLSFLLMAYGWTWAVALPLLAQRRGWLELGLPEAWEGLAAFGPLVAALLVGSATVPGGARLILAGLRNWRVGPAWLLFSCASPVLLLVGATLFLRITTGSWPETTRLASGELASIAGVLDLVAARRGELRCQLRRRRAAATLVLFPARSRQRFSGARRVGCRLRSRRSAFIGRRQRICTHWQR
jgi:hypothetical protein